MFSSFFSSLGGQLGQLFGGGIFSSIGRYAGRLLGNYLDVTNVESEEKVAQAGTILNNLYIQSSAYGCNIPLLYGKAKLAGNIIWAETINEVTQHNTDYKYFARSNKEIITHKYEFKYFLTYAIAICEGEIDYIERVWNGEEIIDLSLYKHRLYKGSEDQLPDTAIEKDFGQGKTPAFRGIAYIVFEQLPLADFNNKLPNFTFEVFRKPKIPELTLHPELSLTVEQMVKSIIMIPGSSEYVYDTNIQYKSTYYNNIEILREAINCHNPKMVADAIYALDSLQDTCPNIEWIAPVVCWFGNSLDIGLMEINPAVEYSSQGIRVTDEWQVANFTRANAKIVSRNDLDNPNYGGTINDASLIRYLQELRRRNLKILFYPFFMLDLPGKPWRGHVTGDLSNIHNFFNKPNGYNNFIIHYAKLVQGKVDAFIIGSELRGITSITDNKGNYPAVTELVKLAAKVKSILGQNVKVSYAADWSEYHHTENGWYHMDELWSSVFIDFIGIDAYFPLTNTSDSVIPEKDIKHGWQSGEGYDYYYDRENTKRFLSPEYAWKNIKYWWENYHYQPNSLQSPWQPKSKKIWFTEFGFPSIDKASNQPNVFYDPKSSDGGVPKYSTGDIDFLIQKRALKATIEVGEKFEFLENMFLWCWDARPYPAWPHGMFWSDGYLWERGHWVNGKLGMSPLAAIILELCKKASISINKIDVSEIDEIIQGVVFNSSLTISEAIHILRCAYFFDFCYFENCLKFTKRGKKFSCAVINDAEVVNDTQSILSIHSAENKLPKSVKLTFIDQAGDYNLNYSTTYYDFTDSWQTYNIKLPLVLDNNESEKIASTILLNARSEYINFNFSLPIQYIFLKPSNIIKFYYNELIINLRIRHITLENVIIKLDTVAEDIKSYLPCFPIVNNLSKKDIKSYFRALNIPLIYKDLNVDNDYVLFTLQGFEKENIYFSSNGSEYIKITELQPNGIITKLISFKNKATNLCLVDNCSELIFYIKQELPTKYFQENNFVILDQEIISYQKITILGENLYAAQGLIRGLFGTKLLNDFSDGEIIIISQEDIFTQPIYDMKEGQQIWFKSTNSEPQLLNHKAISQKLLEPVIKNYYQEGNILNIFWCGRNRNIDDWYSPYLSEVQNYTVILKDISNTETRLITQGEHINIDLKELNLSGWLKIFIIANSNNGFQFANSIPATFEVKVIS